MRCEGGEPVNDNERIARILTTPGNFDVTTRELLTRSLTSVYSCGLSVIRSGISDEEIRLTVDQLVNHQAEPQTLYGAALVSVEQVRAMSEDCRWFGVYSTDDGAKQHHVDILGTTASGESKSQRRKIHDERRYSLRDVLGATVLQAGNVDELIAQLRAAGI